MLSEQKTMKEREKRKKVTKLLNVLTRHLNTHLQIRILGLRLYNLHTWIIQPVGLQRPL